MAKISLTFTDEHIKIIKCLRFRKIDVKHEKSNLLKYTRDIENSLEYSGCDEATKEEVKEAINGIEQISRIDKVYADEDYDKYYGFDTYDFFMNDDESLFLSYILGYKDELDEIEQKKLDLKLEESDVKRDKEIKEHFGELMDFIFTNIIHIEDILHQRCDKGGIQAGVKYVSLDHEGIWYTEEEFKERKRKR